MKRKNLFVLTLIVTFSITTMVVKGQTVPLKAYVQQISGDSIFPVATMVKLNELKPVFKNFTIVSFVFVMSNERINHDLVTISNEGQKFNEPILEAIKMIKQDGTIIFDEIRAINKKGQRINLERLVIHAL